MSLPEERRGFLIEGTPIKPGVGYTISTFEEKISLVKVETIISEGNGKLNISGTNKGNVKQNIRNVYHYRANEKQLLPSNKSLKSYVVTMQLTPFLGAEMGIGIGSGILLAILTAIHKKSSRTALGVLGDISIGGSIKAFAKFSDAVGMLSENGAKSILVSVGNFADMPSVPQSLLTKTDLMFYPSTQVLVQKGIMEE